MDYPEGRENGVGIWLLALHKYVCSIDYCYLAQVYVIKLSVSPRVDPFLTSLIYCEYFKKKKSSIIQRLQVKCSERERQMQRYILNIIFLVVHVLINFN